MNIEKLMIQTVKDLFEKLKGIIDPFNYMIDIYLGIISDDYHDDVIWGDIYDYSTMVDHTIDDIEVNKRGKYIPDHYEDVIDWMEEKGRYVDFSIPEKYKKSSGTIGLKRNRLIVRVKDDGLEKLLKWGGIAYTINPDLEQEQEECKEEAWDHWEDSEDYNKDPYAYYGLSRRDF